MSTETFKTRLQALVDSATKNGPLFLVCHDAHADLKYVSSYLLDSSPLPSAYRYFSQLEISPDISAVPRHLPELVGTEGIYMIDTADLFAALQGDAGNKRALERVAKMLGIKNVERMHNAGNDAHVSLLGFSSILRNLVISDVIDHAVYIRGDGRNGLWRANRYAKGEQMAL
jgi:hypothetical protein